MAEAFAILAGDLVPPGLDARLAALEDVLEITPPEGAGVPERLAALEAALGMPPRPRRAVAPEAEREYAEATAAANALAASDDSPAAMAACRRAGRAIAAYADAAVRPEIAAVVRAILGDLAGGPAERAGGPCTSPADSA